MKQEEKYKEALERASKLRVQNPFDTVGQMVEYIFPELKESEDEKIRKAILEHIQLCTESIPDRDKFIAWLEKQNGQKIDNIEHLIPQKGVYYTCIKDYYLSDNTHLCVKGNIYKSFFNGYIDDESHFGLSWTNSCAEKYFEPTKDEDWIVCEHDNVIGKPMQYKEFKKKVNQKFIGNLKAQGLTPKLRLWNLQDAKDGDVLVNSKGNPFIFSGKCDDRHFDGPIAYCGVTCTNEFKEGYHTWWTSKCGVSPATKEQRELLFSKMKQEGYEWDADKKKLKTIEPKSSDEVEPKFKVGDWITTTDEEGNVTTEKIIEFWGDKVRLIDTNGVYSLWPEHELNYYHLWTINDANDGDVLLEEEIGEPFIYNGNRAISFSGYFLGAHCGIYNGKFNPYGNNHYWGKNSCPATKEQRDLLFQKMGEAEYEWDVDKKKLKKYELKNMLK